MTMRRTKAVIVGTVGIGLGLSAAVAAVAGTPDAEAKGERPVSAKADAAKTSTPAADSPFGPILPPRPLSADSPAGKQYLEAERDLRNDPLEARTFVSDQIDAHYYDRGLSSVRTTGSRSLTVRWKGAAPKNVRDALSSRPYGITIRLIEGVTYTRAATARAAGAVVHHPDARKIWRVSGAGGNGRGTGITVFIVRKSPSEATKRAIAKAAGVPLNDITFRVQQTGPTPL